MCGFSVLNLRWYHHHNLYLWHLTLGCCCCCYSTSTAKRGQINNQISKPWNRVVKEAYLSYHLSPPLSSISLSGSTMRAAIICGIEFEWRRRRQRRTEWASKETHSSPGCLVCGNCHADVHHGQWIVSPAKQAPLKGPVLSRGGPVWQNQTGHYNQTEYMMDKSNQIKWISMALRTS